MVLFRLANNRYSARQILAWLWRAWRGNRTQAVLNALIGLLGVGVSLASVWAVQHAIDVASGTLSGSIAWSVTLMALLILTDFALNVGALWVKNILGIRAQNRMQQRVLDHLLRARWHGRERMHSGDVLNRLELDVATVVTFLTETLPNTLSVLALFLGAFFYLFSMDAVLALIVAGIIPLFVLVSRVYMNRMRTLTRSVRDSDSQVQSVLQETIQHRMLIKTLEGEQPMVDRLESTQSQLRQRVVKRTRFSVFSNLVLNIGFALGYLVAFSWAAVRMSAHTLTFGGMTAFLQLVNKIQTPARNLTRLAPAFVAVFTAAERLMELEENPLEEQGEPIPLPRPSGVRLENVSYTYPGDDQPVLDSLSFDFAPGTCTAILGETGAGKTTLVRIILALLQPDKGKAVAYGGSEQRELSPRLRCNFAYVPQGNTLMSGTLRDNLRLGKLSATDEEMYEALHLACADFVDNLAQGLDTPCSEAGGGLSEGQAQRIAIARALLRDRQVMVFDEATSALDPDTERRLLHNLLAGRRHTVIFITHRPAVVDYCDQVLRVEKLA